MDGVSVSVPEGSARRKGRGDREFARAQRRYEQEQKDALREFDRRLRHDPFYQFMQDLVVNKPSRTGDIIPENLVAFRKQYLDQTKLSPDRE